MGRSEGGGEGVLDPKTKHMGPMLHKNRVQELRPSCRGERRERERDQREEREKEKRIERREEQAEQNSNESVPSLPQVSVSWLGGRPGTPNYPLIYPKSPL